MPFPSYHKRPSAPTNLTLHQTIALNEPIGCGDVAIFPGDVIRCDDDGIMVIPAGISDCWLNAPSQPLKYILSRMGVKARWCFYVKLLAP